MVFGTQLKMNSNNCEKLLLKINKFILFKFRLPSPLHAYIQSSNKIDIESYFIQLSIHPPQEKAIHLILKCTSDKMYSKFKNFTSNRIYMPILLAYTK